MRGLGTPIISYAIFYINLDRKNMQASGQMCYSATRADWRLMIKDINEKSIIIVSITQRSTTNITAEFQGINTIRYWFIVNKPHCVRLYSVNKSIGFLESTRSN